MHPSGRQKLLPQGGEGRGHRRSSLRRGGYRDSDVYVAADAGADAEAGAMVALYHAFRGVEGLTGLMVAARHLAFELRHLSRSNSQEGDRGGEGEMYDISNRLWWHYQQKQRQRWQVAGKKVTSRSAQHGGRAEAIPIAAASCIVSPVRSAHVQSQLVN